LVATITVSDPPAIFLVERPLRLGRENPAIVTPSVASVAAIIPIPVTMVVVIAPAIVIVLKSGGLDLDVAIHLPNLRYSRKAQGHQTEGDSD
jgi:hypothetical protein